MNQIRNFNQSLTWFLSNKSLHLDKEGPWVVDMYAENLSYLYRALPDLKVKKEKELIEISLLNNTDYTIKDADFLSPVVSLKDYVQENFEDDLVDFIIHGSIASLDYSIGWSDLDTYVIVKSESILDSKKLIKLRKGLIEASNYLTKVDPLQHHGFIYATEFDINNYFSHCLPVKVLQKSKSLLKSSTMKVQNFRSQEDTYSFLEGKVKFFKNCTENKAMFHHGIDGVYLLEDFEEKTSMYQMKYFLSVLMSMPVFFLDAMGESSYKRDSYARAKGYFSKNWDIIELASSIREDWPGYESFPYSNNEIPEWLIERLNGDYFARSYSLASEMISVVSEEYSKK